MPEKITENDGEAADMNRREISFSPPDISESEVEAVVAALRSGWITTGPRTKEFETQIASYIGVGKAVCLASATSAMEMVLRMIGVGPGDEVITSAYTYTASAAVIDHVGATIVLSDTKPDSFELDYEKLGDLISEKTKAIIPIDIGGKLCDYDKIYRIVEEKRSVFQAKGEFQAKLGRICVLEDAAHAFGSIWKNQMCGTFADITCFSFHAVKNLTTAEGGAVVWRNDLGFSDSQMYKTLMLYSLHGQTKDASEKMRKGAWEYDIAFPGYKCNMTDLTAALGMAQLDRFDGLIKRRAEIFDRYDRALLPLGIRRLPRVGADFVSNAHLYMTWIPGIDEKARNRIIQEMAEKGVSVNVHFKPLPLFTAYRNLGFKIGDFPNTYRMYAGEITLPMHTLLSDDDIDYVIEVFTGALAPYRDVMAAGKNT